MKIALLSSLLLATSVQASPFLWANVDDNTDTCVYTNSAGVKSWVFAAPISPPIPGVPAGMVGPRLCWVDLAGSPTGVNNIKLGAIGAWGSSVEVPFAFTSGAAPAAPFGLKIAT